MTEKIRWFVYEIDPTAQVGMIERLKPCSHEDAPSAALTNIYSDNTEVFEGHDVISGTAYYVFKSWETTFIVSTSRMKVSGELRAFECWA